MKSSELRTVAKRCLVAKSALTIAEAKRDEAERAVEAAEASLKATEEEFRGAVNEQTRRRAFALGDTHDTGGGPVRVIVLVEHQPVSAGVNPNTPRVTYLEAE